MKTMHFAALASSALVLAACGGGGGGTAATTLTSTAALSYGKPAVIQLAGANLDATTVVIAPGCTALTAQAGGSSTLRKYDCTAVTTATTLDVTAQNAAGTTIAQASLAVPDPQVTLVTSKGTVVLELNPAKAPITVDNYLKYVNDGFYNNLIFHRVISTFMIQGGGFTSGPTAKAPTYPAIVLESQNGLSNVRGSLAMARTNVENSATSQFYINVVDNLSLNYASAASPGYAVFGKVVTGLDVVDLIKIAPTAVRNGYANVPTTDVTITSAAQTR